MKLSKIFIRTSISFALMFSLFGVFILVLYNSYQNKQQQIAERKLNRITYLIANNLNSKKTIANVLTGFASYKGSIDSAAFSNLASHIYQETNHKIQCIQWAPKAIIKYVYPYEKNKKALGLNLLEYSLTKDLSLNSIKSRESHLNGPIPLVQGGMGLVVRVPVFKFSNSKQKKESDFIGFAAVVVRLDEFIKECGLQAIDRKSIALKIDPNNREKKHFKYGTFFGNPNIFFSDQHVEAKINATRGKWIIAVKKDNLIFTNESIAFIMLLGLMLSLAISFLQFSNLKNQNIIRLKNEELTKKNSEIEKQIDVKMLLINEIHHRVKNNFQLVSSLARLQSYELKDPKAIEAFQDFGNRVSSFALTHEQLIYNEAKSNEIEIKEYVSSLIQNLNTNSELQNISFNLQITKEKIELKKLILIGIIINELVANSYKHSFPLNEKGKINIQIKHIVGKFELNYSDDGDNFNDNILQQETHSFGIELIKSISEQLEGKLEIVSIENVNSFKLSF